MVQEYLFVEKEHREALEQYRPKVVKPEITKEIEDIENSECWIVRFKTKGEGEQSARHLSALNREMLEQYSPTVLTNESSAYFNKSLFPLFNEFERKLRKLLYLKSALSKNQRDSDIIKDLEKKDLGKIFELLFTDEEFISRTKKEISRKTWQFTKAEILESLGGIDENTLWDALMGEDSVPELRKKFLTLKDFRNDVMHAHNMDTTTFNSAKKMLTEVNDQLTAEIRKITKADEEKEEIPNDVDFNKTMREAIQRKESQYINDIVNLDLRLAAQRNQRESIRREADVVNEKMNLLRAEYDKLGQKFEYLQKQRAEAIAAGKDEEFQRYTGEYNRLADQIESTAMKLRNMDDRYHQILRDLTTQEHVCEVQEMSLCKAHEQFEAMISGFEEM